MEHEVSTEAIVMISVMSIFAAASYCSAYYVLVTSDTISEVTKHFPEMSVTPFMKVASVVLLTIFTTSCGEPEVTVVELPISKAERVSRFKDITITVKHWTQDSTTMLYDSMVATTEGSRIIYRATVDNRNN